MESEKVDNPATHNSDAEQMRADGQRSREADEDSEHCWEEMYRGDSRKWLFKYSVRKPWDPPLMSTMKDHFRYPQPEDPNINVGE